MDSETDAFPRSIANVTNLLASRGYDVNIGYRDGEPAAVRAVRNDVRIMIEDWRRTWACSVRSPELEYGEMYDRPDNVEAEVREWLDKLAD